MSDDDDSSVQFVEEGDAAGSSPNNDTSSVQFVEDGGASSRRDNLSGSSNVHLSPDYAHKQHGSARLTPRAAGGRHPQQQQQLPASGGGGAATTPSDRQQQQAHMHQQYFVSPPSGATQQLSSSTDRKAQLPSSSSNHRNNTSSSNVNKAPGATPSKRLSASASGIGAGDDDDDSESSSNWSNVGGMATSTSAAGGAVVTVSSQQLIQQRMSNGSFNTNNNGSTPTASATPRADSQTGVSVHHVPLSVRNNNSKRPTPTNSQVSGRHLSETSSGLVFVEETAAALAPAPVAQPANRPAEQLRAPSTSSTTIYNNNSSNPANNSEQPSPAAPAAIVSAAKTLPATAQRQQSLPQQQQQQETATTSKPQPKSSSVAVASKQPISAQQHQQPRAGSGSRPPAQMAQEEPPAAKVAAKQPTSVAQNDSATTSSDALVVFSEKQEQPSKRRTAAAAGAAPARDSYDAARNATRQQQQQQRYAQQHNEHASYAEGSPVGKGASRMQQQYGANQHHHSHRDEFTYGGSNGDDVSASTIGGGDSSMTADQLGSSGSLRVAAMSTPERMRAFNERQRVELLRLEQYVAKERASILAAQSASAAGGRAASGAGGHGGEWWQDETNDGELPAGIVTPLRHRRTAVCSATHNSKSASAAPILPPAAAGKAKNGEQHGDAEVDEMKPLPHQQQRRNPQHNITTLPADGSLVFAHTIMNVINGESSSGNNNNNNNNNSNAGTRNSAGAVTSSSSIMPQSNNSSRLMVSYRLSKVNASSATAAVPTVRRSWPAHLAEVAEEWNIHLPDPAASAVPFSASAGSLTSLVPAPLFFLTGTALTAEQRTMFLKEVSARGRHQEEQQQQRQHQKGKESKNAASAASAASGSQGGGGGGSKNNNNSNNNNLRVIHSHVRASSAADQQQQQQQKRNFEVGRFSSGCATTCDTCHLQMGNIINNNGDSAQHQQRVPRLRHATTRMTTLRRLYQRLLPSVPVDARAKVRVNRRGSIAHYNPVASEEASGVRLVTQQELALAQQILQDAMQEDGLANVECGQCRKDLYILGEFVLPLLMSAPLHEWTFSSFALFMHGAAKVNPDFADLLVSF